MIVVVVSRSTGDLSTVSMIIITSMMMVLKAAG